MVSPLPLGGAYLLSSTSSLSLPGCRQERQRDRALKVSAKRYPEGCRTCRRARAIEVGTEGSEPVSVLVSHRTEMP